ncbi:MAG: riboflavin synthase [Candidatus Omnitrophota bacterium]|jgi:riboflavin synthase|nr:MAG: riboflavin synthase [Candidatus Omnitrophota bacterium]
MFTGIIEELGVVKSFSKTGSVSLLTINQNIIGQNTNIGDSIAVNGVCLTVVKNEAGSLSFEMMPITSQDTNLRKLSAGAKVNLERSLKLGDRLSGHFVSGHIDCIGVIRRKKHISGNICFEIAYPVQKAAYLVPKGSVAVDGISLTVMDKKADIFAVHIIPHTFKNTTLSFKAASDEVNIEFDLLAKINSSAVPVSRY